MLMGKMGLFFISCVGVISMAFVSSELKATELPDLAVVITGEASRNFREGDFCGSDICAKDREDLKSTAWYKFKENSLPFENECENNNGNLNFINYSESCLDDEPPGWIYRLVVTCTATGIATCEPK